jgi:hypothetical protein
MGVIVTSQGGSETMTPAPAIHGRRPPLIRPEPCGVQFGVREGPRQRRLYHLPALPCRLPLALDGAVAGLLTLPGLMICFCMR